MDLARGDTNRSLARVATILPLLQAGTPASIEEPVRVFRRALENVRPRVEVKSRRVGGATYQVPVEVSPGRGSALAMRWVVQFARARAGKSMQEKLAAELLDAAAERGEAVRKREETHRMADANKAYAHYRW